jgi:valyl-tRNA synthetase
MAAQYGGKIMLHSGASAPRWTTGASATMDDAYVRAVMHFFVHLYRKGWIYRANGSSTGALSTNVALT